MRVFIFGWFFFCTVVNFVSVQILYWSLFFLNVIFLYEFQYLGVLDFVILFVSLKNFINISINCLYSLFLQHKGTEIEQDGSPIKIL